MTKSTLSAKRRKAASKPAKPYQGFPRFPHDSGRRAKKVRGKLVYFGRWATVEAGKLTEVDDVRASALAAAELYNKQRDDLQAASRAGMTTP